MDERNVIGLDCGASHSSVAVWENNKKVFFRSDLPGVNPDIVDSVEARELLAASINELVVYRNASWVVGMAGLDDKGEVEEANNWFRVLLNLAGITYSKFVVLSDIDLVLWAGDMGGAGIGLIAGTGSNCMGRNKFGQSYKTGGMSHILSDEGAGFSLGWKCLHLVTKMVDGRAERTMLVDEVLELYKCANIIDLKNLLVQSTRLKVLVAKSAETLLAASDRGEEEAMRICAEESTELIRMVSAVNSGVPSEELLPVFLAGSLFRNKNYLDLFEVGLGKYSPSQKVTLVSPIDGALIFANSVP